MPLLIILLLLFSMSVYGEQQKQELPLEVKEVVVVTASKTGVSMKDVARSVIVIDREEIQISNTTDVVELIREKAGIHIAQNGAGPGVNSSLFVRGANSNYNLILIDGVPLNMPGGDYDLGDLSLDGVERIEIVKGPVSVIYGPYAVASVINIITKKDGSKGSKVSFAAGNYGTFHELFDVNMNKGDWRFNLYGSRLDSERQLELNNKYYRNVLGMRLDYNVSRDSSLSFHLRWNKAKDNYPTGSAGDRFMPIELYDHDQYIKNSEVFFATQYGMRHNSWQPIIRFSYIRMKLDYYDEDSGMLIDPFGPYFGNDEVSRYIIEMQNNISYKSHLFTLGVEYQREEFNSMNNYSIEPFMGERGNVGLYMQDQWKDGREKLYITTGIRADKNSNYNLAMSPQVSLSYKITADTFIKSNIGLGFKAPSFWQTLGGGFATGNPELKPEKNISFDLSYQYKLDRYKLRIEPAVFLNKFYDLVQYEPHFNPEIPDYENVGSAYSYGAELEMEKYISDGFSIKLSSAYIIAREDSDSEEEIERMLLRRPKYTANLDFKYDKDKLSSLFSFIFVGRRVDLDYSKSMFSAERVWAPSYYLVNISFRYKIRNNIKATMRMENLLNKKYEEVYGYTARKRTILLGLEIGW